MIVLLIVVLIHSIVFVFNHLGFVAQLIILLSPILLLIKLLTTSFQIQIPPIGTFQFMIINIADIINQQNILTKTFQIYKRITSLLLSINMNRFSVCRN